MYPILDEIQTFTAWTNPFLPVSPCPSRASRIAAWIASWTCPGLLSLAPEPSEKDQHTWDEVTSYTRPASPRTLREALLRRIAEQQRELWPVPDDPFGSIEWIRAQRLRPFSSIAAGIIDDPALRLPRRR